MTGKHIADPLKVSTGEADPLFRELAAETRRYAALSEGDRAADQTTVTSDQSMEATGELNPLELPTVAEFLVVPDTIVVPDTMAIPGTLMEEAQVVVEKGTRIGCAYGLGRTTLIGRSRSCDVRLDDSAIGAQHVLLSWNAGTWSVRDLGSTNGTFLNGRRIGAEAAIAPGDRLTLGESTLRFEAGDLSKTIDDDRPLGEIAPLGMPPTQTQITLPPLRSPPLHSIGRRRFEVPPAYRPEDDASLEWAPEDTGLVLSPEVRRALRLVLWSFLFSSCLVAVAIVIRVLR